ncbi:hypothetical protein [Helicobacter cetorum]|nr:hypothetical protein [Helicobacter cetorum]
MFSNTKYHLKPKKLKNKPFLTRFDRLELVLKIVLSLITLVLFLKG